MMSFEIPGGGIFPDVAFHAGVVYCGVQQSQQVVLYKVIAGQLGLVRAWPCSALAFVRLLDDAGTLWIAFRDEMDRAAICTLSVPTPTAFGLAFGNHCVALTPGWFAYQDDLTRRVLATELVPLGQSWHVLRDEVRPSGIARLNNRIVVFNDENRNAMAGGVNPQVSNR